MRREIRAIENERKNDVIVQNIHPDNQRDASKQEGYGSNYSHAYASVCQIEVQSSQSI